MAMRSELKEKPKNINMAVVMLILVVSGLACVAVLQRVLEMRASSQAVSRAAEWVEGPTWHLELDDVPEEKIFIGFKYDGHIYMDASVLCRQPGFRRHAESGAEKPLDQNWLFEAPDIKLPSELVNENWWVISGGVPPESHEFAGAYQWFGHDAAPPNRACLFLGQKEQERIPQEFRMDRAEPVIGLMGFSYPLNQYLQVHEGAIKVTPKNRLETLRKFPWLLAWLHQFSSDGAKQCGSSDGFMPSSLVLPIKVKILPGAQQTMHWFAATGCEHLDRWALVMANEDGTTSFITLNESMGAGQRR